MALCLHNVSGLKKRKNDHTGGRVRLVDAAWVWTEPHSMRVKLRLTIQREVSDGGTILQQAFIVTFVVRNQQCVECQAAFRQGSWKSVVQVRQRVGHKRTFLYLEQLILKHGAHRGCLSIETFKDGMDFYFPDKGKAARFISFLEDVVPMKVCVYNLLHTLSVCIPCICSDINLIIFVSARHLFEWHRSNLRKSSLVPMTNPTCPTISTPTSSKSAPSVKTTSSSYPRN